MKTQIILRDHLEDIIEIRKHKFTIRNLNKIAYDYDAEILSFDLNTKHAVFKDHLNRYIFADRI